MVFDLTDIYIFGLGGRKTNDSFYKKRNKDTFSKLLVLPPLVIVYQPEIATITSNWVAEINGYNLMQDFSYRSGDYLLFGSETSGLPPEALSDCKHEPYGGGTLRIPMVETYVRCMNLSVSVGIALYEASRQLNYEQIECAPEGCVNGEEPLLTEDIFA